ncbi:hypothetical protein SPHV1_100041 [Novosphingobium sp. KN65.2]|nr:hypothetical protein SPHV1_100041 [Novosphingobium sp. KN65.2]
MREDWTPYFEWLESRLFMPGRWAVIPDAPGAPSQLNDSLLPQWPFGPAKGAPLWHMDGPIDRLLRLCDIYPRVCLGWTGTGEDAAVGCEAWFRRMDEIAPYLGNRPPVLHHMRGVLVAREYDFIDSADATSGAQNGWRYDTSLDFGDRWAGRRAYLDRLAAGHFPKRVRSRLSRNRDAARSRGVASALGSPRDRTLVQFGLW